MLTNDITITARAITQTREQVRISYLDGITGEKKSEIAFKPKGTAERWAREYGFRYIR
jgi:hypothetical protein